MLGLVLFSPHDIRHLYVSWILRQMKQRYATNPEKQATLKLALQHQMAWRSPLTMACYDQSESERERLEQFDHFLQELGQQAKVHEESPVARLPQVDASSLPVPPMTEPCLPQSTAQPMKRAGNEAVPTTTQRCLKHSSS